ncbi:MAG: 5-oxoprolinase subunit PxpB [Balneolaceae bacterium]
MSEQALLLEPRAKTIPLESIHQTTRILEQAEIAGVVDIVPAYNSIAIIYERLLFEVEAEVVKIQQSASNQEIESRDEKNHMVPVCYELGMDWKAVQKLTSQEREEVIQKHLAAEYKVAMMGFIPGFVYLQGLDESIACPRKENPRIAVPAGSVGIGGNQAGIYSLESPGGWQIIGRTPVSFFDPEINPPTQVKPGDQLAFERITKAEFQELNEAPK